MCRCGVTVTVTVTVARGMCAFKDALGHCPVARYFIGSVQRSPAQLRHHCLKRHVSHMNRSFTVSIWVHVSVIKYNNWFHIFISPRLPRRRIKKNLSLACHGAVLLFYAFNATELIRETYQFRFNLIIFSS